MKIYHMRIGNTMSDKQWSGWSLTATTADQFKLDSLIVWKFRIGL